jgi:hypothetical protein
MTGLEHFEHGFLGVVVHAFGKVLRNGFIALLIGFLVGEALGIALNPSPGLNAPTLFVHVMAGVLAVVLAFGVAMATALAEAIRAVLTALHAVGGAAEEVADAGVREAGHVAAEVEHTVEPDR